jgi:hypothetical protein
MKKEYLWHKDARRCMGCKEYKENTKAFFALIKGQQDFIYYCSKSCLNKILSDIAKDIKKKKEPKKKKTTSI